jgi:hypothetical protein
MANWLERARREIQKTPCRPTANSAKRNLPAVMAVPHRGFGKNRRLLSAVTAVPHRGISRKSRRQGCPSPRHGGARGRLPRWPSAHRSQGRARWRELKTALALGSWLAFQSQGDQALVMGRSRPHRRSGESSAEIAQLCAFYRRCHKIENFLPPLRHTRPKLPRRCNPRHDTTTMTAAR